MKRNRIAVSFLKYIVLLALPLYSVVSWVNSLGGLSFSEISLQQSFTLISKRIHLIIVNLAVVLYYTVLLIVKLLKNTNVSHGNVDSEVQY